jgi:hypothetical protein
MSMRNRGFKLPPFPILHFRVATQKVVHVTFTTRRETCPPIYINNVHLVRFEVFMAVTEEWCPLGCYAVWLLQEPQGVTSQKTPFFNVHRSKQEDVKYFALHLERRLTWRKYIRKPEATRNDTKMYWLLGRKSKLHKLQNSHIRL